MLEDVVNKEMAPWRFSAWVFALFAALAFALAMLGLFSLVSLDVVNRRQEFAIRMAIGATEPTLSAASSDRRAHAPAHRHRRGGWRSPLVATSRLQSLLFGVPLNDALTYASVVALVVVVVALASYVPARRAASAAPLALLRRE